MVRRAAARPARDRLASQAGLLAPAAERRAHGAYPVRCLPPQGIGQEAAREPPSTYPPGPRLSTLGGPPPASAPPAPGPDHRRLPGRAGRRLLPRLRGGPAGPLAPPGAAAHPAVPAGPPPPPGPRPLAAGRTLPAGR